MWLWSPFPDRVLKHNSPIMARRGDPFAPYLLGCPPEDPPPPNTNFRQIARGGGCSGTGSPPPLCPTSAVKYRFLADPPPLEKGVIWPVPPSAPRTNSHKSIPNTVHDTRLHRPSSSPKMPPRHPPAAKSKARSPTPVAMPL